MHTVEIINFAIMCLFFACYMYQFLYIPISWFAAKKPAPPAGAHRFAVLYDEQPVRFHQSWVQRLRWSRGYMQVFRKYGRALISGIFRGSFSCYDMTMSIMPAAVLTGLSIVVNIGAAAVNIFYYKEWGVLGVSALQMLLNLYLTLFVIGGITTATEWRSIHCTTAKKLLYAFTFPVFMLTYVPIVIESLFITPEWTHIDHTRALDVHDICTEGKRAV